MRQLWAISVVCLFFFLLSGCTRRTKQNDEDAPQEVAVQPNVQVQPPQVQPQDTKKIIDKTPAKAPLDKAQQEKYDAALTSALTALAERKWRAALAAFETAKSVQNTEFVQAEITRLQQRIDQEKDAKTTLQNIETVLKEGKADVALKLAKEALQEFGAGDDAPRFIQLRLKAEALLEAEKKEGPEARLSRLRKEGDAALAEMNLRAAVLAYEQVLLGQEDAELQKTYDDLRNKLDTYDALRKQAVELRRDPAQLDATIVALKGAKEAWDTLQVRQELEEAILALQNRRDTVSVVDFEVRNDVGVPNAGVGVADELLPLLKKKFDPVMRRQVQRALAELKPETSVVNDPAVQKQVGELAKVRYLVVGSIHRIVAVSVRARLVDARTGLVVQTAKVLAPTMEEAMTLVPELARQLLMSDQDKMKDPPNVAMLPKMAAPNAPLPPAPMQGNAPPPLIQANLMPAAPAPMKGDPFAQFAASPQSGLGGPLSPDLPFRSRVLQASVEMGDYLFLSGRFAEAQRQYQFALAVDPNNPDLQLRWQRCLPLVPPTMLRLGQPQLLIARPRLTVLTFGVGVNPLVTPPELSYWTPQNLAPYFSPRYDVADPTEVAWFMARTGLTVNDLVNNPYALGVVGQAVGVRYFVFGTHQENFNGGFDVSAYLVDANLAYQVGAGRISVQNPFELRLRLPELAALTMMTADDRARYAAQQAQFSNLLASGLNHMNQRDYDLAVGDFSAAVNLRPDSVQAQVYLNQAQQLAALFNYQNELRRNQQAQAATYAAAQQRRAQLAQTALLAGRNAVAAAGTQTDAERQANTHFRFRAQANLLTQAQAAQKARRFGLAVNLFEGAQASAPVATTPAPSDVTLPSQQDIERDLAQARLAAEKDERLRIAETTAASEAALRKQRERQLAQAQAQLALEQKRSLANQEAARQTQATRDEQAYAASLKQGQLLLAQSKFDAALAALQTAQSLKATAAVSQLIELTGQRQALALAKTEQDRQTLEKKFQAERERRQAAEAQAKQKEATYQTALQAAQKALTDKNYADAKAKFEEAGQVYRTDAVLAGLKEVERAQTTLPPKTELTPAETAANKAKVQEWITTGQAALKAKNYDAAEKALRSASLVDPTNPMVVQGLQDVADARAKTQASFKQAFDAGQTALNNKKYTEAVTALKTALQIIPNNAGAQQLLQQAQQSLQGNESQASYQKALTAGQKALTAKQYASAITAFNTALKLMPNDPQATELLQQAQQAQATARQQAADLAQKQAKYQALMRTGQTAMFNKNYASAVKAYSEALTLSPKDVQATRGLQSARNALEAAPVKTTPTGEPGQTFEQAMQKAAAMEKEQKFADAASAFQDALKYRPKDATAFAGYNRNQFNAHLSQGQQYLNTMMFMEATREFESALRIAPNNPNALRLLQKAKNKMR